MSELQTIEREVEERVHTILHELEAQLKGIFGTQPQISQSVAEAKKKVSAITTPIVGSVQQNPIEDAKDAGISDAPNANVPSPTPSSASTSSEDHPATEA